jgi:hypothetical protein
MAITTAMLANKSRRVGANMLELTTCGAIPPYNHILAGKLTALLLLSPQVADDYRRRYGKEPSIISSLLKNTPLVLNQAKPPGSTARFQRPEGDVPSPVPLDREWNCCTSLRL